jgi:hypothetical protein
MEAENQPARPGTWAMAPRACTKCGAPMPAQFTTPVVECRCPEGHEAWYYDRPQRTWRRGVPGQQADAP